MDYSERIELIYLLVLLVLAFIPLIWIEVDQSLKKRKKENKRR